MICDAFLVQLDSRRSWLKGLRAIRVDGQQIDIVTTPCNFGGERRWFLCPGCNRRCAILRTGLRCNECLGARHRSELSAPVDRMSAKARKLRRRLGQEEPNPTFPIPPKPHRMRWHTYMRIRAEISRLENENLTILTRGWNVRGR